MVNIRTGPDERDFEILATLRACTEPVSGQVLADRLGISRVALWKRIARLRGFAYRIESEGRGYRLLEDDAVVAEEFGAKQAVEYHPETGSTMDDARRLAEEGAPSGTLVIAERQSAGRGRKGRAWRSPEGGLYLTLVLRPRIPASFGAGLALEGACAVAHWLEERGCALGLHWPNDLMAGERKVGGLLVELAGPLEEPWYFLLGLGLNLKAVRLPDRSSTGLRELMERPPLRRELAAAFQSHMTAWAAAPQFRPEDWARRCPMVGRSVSLQDWKGHELAGLAEGFGPRGELIFRGPQGRTALLPGEVHRIRIGAHP